MSAVLQTAVDLAPALGLEGALVSSFSPYKAVSRMAAGEIQAGRMAFRAHGALAGQASSPAGEPGRVWQNPSPANSADVDAIIATGASSASLQSLDSSDADGVVGADDMTPGRKLTLVLSSHTDWDATSATIRYVDQLSGLTVSESLSIPDGGNT